MQTKQIEKLKELKGFEWGNRNRIKENHGSSMNSLVFERLTKTVNGESKWIDMFNVSANNLDELEFYGLKVILNEKPKLTREDKRFLEEDFYVARDKNGKLFMYGSPPDNCYIAGSWTNTSSNSFCTEMDSSLFPFITWESGKAWSKKELMELEVVE